MIFYSNVLYLIHLATVLADLYFPLLVMNPDLTFSVEWLFSKNTLRTDKESRLFIRLQEILAGR